MCLGRVPASRRTPWVPGAPADFDGARADRRRSPMACGSACVQVVAIVVVGTQRFESHRRERSRQAADEHGGRTRTHPPGSSRGGRRRCPTDRSRPRRRLRSPRRARAAGEHRPHTSRGHRAFGPRPAPRIRPNARGEGRARRAHARAAAPAGRGARAREEYRGLAPNPPPHRDPGAPSRRVRCS